MYPNIRCDSFGDKIYRSKHRLNKKIRNWFLALISIRHPPSQKKKHTSSRSFPRTRASAPTAATPFQASREHYWSTDRPDPTMTPWVKMDGSWPSPAWSGGTPCLPTTPLNSRSENAVASPAPDRLQNARTLERSHRTLLVSNGPWPPHTFTSFGFQSFDGERIPLILK